MKSSGLCAHGVVCGGVGLHEKRRIFKVSTPWAHQILQFLREGFYEEKWAKANLPFSLPNLTDFECTKTPQYHLNYLSR